MTIYFVYWFSRLCWQKHLPLPTNVVWPDASHGFSLQGTIFIYPSLLPSFHKKFPSYTPHILKIQFLCWRTKELVCSYWQHGTPTKRWPKAQSRSPWSCQQLATPAWDSDRALGVIQQWRVRASGWVHTSHSVCVCSCICLPLMFKQMDPVPTLLRGSST